MTHRYYHSVLPIKGYLEINFNYLRGAFAEVGLLVHQKGGTIECRWPVSAWEYNPVAPVAANTGTWNKDRIAQGKEGFK